MKGNKLLKCLLVQELSRETREHHVTFKLIEGTSETKLTGEETSETKLTGEETNC